jgi:UDP-N-acetylmuramate--alanine ligase
VDGAEFYATFPELEAELKRKAQPGDIILTVGAGDVYKIGENIVE